ncbi:hypothetical protein ACIRSS_13775 [Amycolatopsis sp. NPDC101161]|uniref:hypothetical protein n=1 Tax=Amycolatopsis sp. NPDC101161 TaxID=3363940 RepID=UPI0038076A9F
MVLVDYIAASLLMLGYAKVAAVDNVTKGNVSEIVAGLAVGLLGPLALRSPVKRSEVKGKSVSVGFTYLYDVARLNAVFALDERMVRLRRQDLNVIRGRWMAAGLLPAGIAEEVVRHAKEMPSIDEADKKRIGKEVASVLTLPDEEEKFNMLITILRNERFRSIIDHYNDLAKSSVVSVSVADQAPESRLTGEAAINLGEKNVT